MDMKKCSKCSVEKSLNNFQPRKDKKDGLASWCRECVISASYKHKNTPQGKKVHNESVKRFFKTSKGKIINERYQNKWDSGVYGIYDSGICLYIGESSKLVTRISKHLFLLNNPNLAGYHKPLYTKLNQNHKHIVIGILEQCDNHIEREQHYIDTIKPLYNKKKSG